MAYEQNLPYRHGVLAVFQNKEGMVLIGRRKGTESWQFPQGGIDENESPVSALKREMQEEVGCFDLVIIKDLMTPTVYDFPRDLNSEIIKFFKGQSLLWFLCHGSADLKKATDQEFDDISWVDPQIAFDRCVDWKKETYKIGLHGLGLYEGLIHE